MKVKICGITNKEDATWAINYGADFIGLNFYKDSPRHISLSNAVAWVPQLPSFTTAVGIFVNADKDEIVKTVDKLNLKGIQLHGDESPEFIQSVRVALEGQGRSVFIIKAFHISDESTLNNIPFFAEVVDYFLLDSKVDDTPGGTGVRFNWDLAVKVKEMGKPVFLAGGLTPENVKEAVKKVAPFAVDVASGVEKSPKRKDPQKLQDFINNAKRIR
ncbi:MAG: phosphoribosylanthranilate isomerase [Elusimicrobia bacterium]|nr:phosphoribosylanthranilate isomerase [Candidatus Obscuribacterium magneticum]